MFSTRSDNGSYGRSTPATVSGHHQCPVCLKRYKRREHLQRHIGSHTSERPYHCTSCDGAFQRADVLRRHLRTCDGRVAGPSRVTARRRACDRCVRQKKACNSRQPCQSCSKKALECCYSTSPNSGRGTSDYGTVDTIDMDKDLGSPDRDPMSLTSDIMTPFGLPGGQLESLVASSVHPFLDPNLLDCSNPSWQDFLALASESQALCEPPIADANGRHSLHFLDSFTSKIGFVHTFDCGTLEQREQVMSKLELEAACEPQQVTLSSISLLSEVPNGVVASPILENMHAPSTAEVLPLSWLDDPLSLKTHQILLLVKEVVTVKPRNSAVTLEWSPALEHACLRFFSPANLRKFLGLYWAIWHPNVNFVHRPTFDPISAKSTILAAMALIGACVSPDLPDSEDARMWFNCVEEMVFIDEDFNSDSAYLPSGGPVTHRRKIQALQAAYMVCLYQNWEGTDASKSRVRRYRFATLVSTARDIDISTARHRNYSGQARYEFEWNDFAAREELIRVFTWIFLLDTAFVIFNNLPPRMVIKEMKMHMAVPEACFQAATADQCYEQIQLFLPKKCLYWDVSFRCAFECLSKDNLSMNLRQLLAALGPLNLFALTSAIHSLIFQYWNSFGSCELLFPIRNALSNWRDTWQLFAAASSPGISPHVTVDNNNLQPETMWKRVGFCRYCPEYWLLASLMADRLAASCTAQPENERQAEQNEGDAEHSELEPLDDGPLDPILNKYDTTSMRQVNDLILGFQKVQIR